MICRFARARFAGIWRRVRDVRRGAVERERCRGEQVVPRHRQREVRRVVPPGEEVGCCCRGAGQYDRGEGCHLRDR